MDLLFIPDCKETIRGVWAPFYTINSFVWQLIFPDDFSCPRVPDHEIVVFISRGQEHAVWRYWHCPHCCRMEFEVDWDLGREWLQIIRRWQFRDKLTWISNVDLLLQQPWTQIQVKAPLEMLLDEVLVERNFPERFELLREIVGLSVILIVLKPFLFLFVIKEVFFRWVDWFGMSGEVSLWCCDRLWHSSWLPCHDRVVFPDVPYLFCFFLTFLFLLFLLRDRFHMSFLDRLYELWHFQPLPLRRNEAPLWGVTCLEWMNHVFIFYLKVEIFERINIFVCEFSWSDPLNEFEIRLWKSYMLVI